MNFNNDAIVPDLNKWPFVQVYIMSRNRREYLEESLLSCLDIKYANFEVIVSDNSTDDTTRAWLSQLPYKNKFKTLHRNNLSYVEHTNLILKEVTAPYFMMFHDDDLLLPDSLEKYIDVMLKDTSLSAVAGNTYFIDNKVKTKIKSMQITQNQKIDTKAQFVEKYFFKIRTQPSFPVYMYRADKMKGVSLSLANGGVYSDSSFVFKVMNNGGLCLLSDVVGYYRFHGQNISSKINLRNINTMVKYFLKSVPEAKKLLLTYKYMIWLKYYFKSCGIKKNKVIFLVSIKFLIKNPKYFIYRLCFKLVSKLNA